MITITLNLWTHALVFACYASILPASFAMYLTWRLTHVQPKAPNRYKAGNVARYSGEPFCTCHPQSKDGLSPTDYFLNGFAFVGLNKHGNFVFKDMHPLPYFTRKIALRKKLALGYPPHRGQSAMDRPVEDNDNAPMLPPVIDFRSRLIGRMLVEAWARERPDPRRAYRRGSGRRHRQR